MQGSGVSGSDVHATPSPWSHSQLEQPTSIHEIAQRDAVFLLAVEGERSSISRCSIPDSEWDTTGVAHGWWQVRVSRKNYQSRSRFSGQGTSRRGGCA